MKRFENMTMRLSWGLVLFFFIGAVVILSALGLSALGRAVNAVAEIAPHAGAEGALQLRTFEFTAGWMRFVIWAVLLGTLMTAGGVVWGITINVLQPLDRLVGYFERLVEGDLTQSVERRGNNEIGRLYNALADVQEGFSGTVDTVRSSSEGIYHGAQEIAQGNSDLSSRTEQQAASLAETASSMEELASTVEHNAENARQASQLAAEATRTAKQGGTVVGEVVTTMHDINESSHKMSDIIEVIDNIAFQTNILALNASVEAARAGEHGRGFAVVAQEVRNLAGRSGNAAGEIRQLIEASLKRVDVGTRRVDTAGQTMTEIVAAVQRVSDIMDEIASASQEQSNGIGQVNQAVTQMDQVTQQNATLVQQAATAATQLEAEAASLRQAVVHFRLAGQQADASKPVARKALGAPAPRDPMPGDRHKPSTSNASRQGEEEWASF
ncbi:methyl-accepting chemotaxis protein [Halomonas alkalisoli]|uniref:methyl-accepting chemotaxis protein n=1 Tax=Halomonas alkalisoli TaxID=2907158 RepID=UPI001F1B79FA|nr:methyl-accepting chemotaxis protein [Halomonas alkalisoli]